MASVNKVLDFIGNESIDDTPVLVDWAIDADKAIGSFYDYKEEIHVLEVSNCRTKLPCGTIEVRGLLLGDHGCNCNLTFDNAKLVIQDLSTGVETTGGLLAIAVVDSGDVTCNISNIRWWVQNNNVIMDQNFDGNKVTVKLLMYQLDGDGFPLINEYNVKAIASYLEWRLAKRSMWSKNPREQFNMNMLRDLEARWERLCSDARAESSYPSNGERQELADMINNPISGRGIDTTGLTI
tara:strand:- start:95 stop:808 length:714 start_codon:yes stop_codon:yes gene_type:complete